MRTKHNSYEKNFVNVLTRHIYFYSLTEEFRDFALFPQSMPFSLPTTRRNKQRQRERAVTQIMNIHKQQPRLDERTLRDKNPLRLLPR